MLIFNKTSINLSLKILHIIILVHIGFVADSKTDKEQSGEAGDGSHRGRRQRHLHDPGGARRLRHLRQRGAPGCQVLTF